MKLDKEWILKHRFWLLLGTVGLLWFVGLIVLWVIGSGPIEAAQKTYTDAVALIKPYDTASGPKRPKNASFLPKWVDYGDKFKEHKNTVWKIAWNGDERKPDDPPGKLLWPGQKGMVTWPSTDDHRMNQIVLSPATEIDAPLRQWYKGNEDASPYRNQFQALYHELKSTPDEATAALPSVPVKALDPLIFLGSDRTADGDYQAYLGLMHPVDVTSVSSPPSTEECWLLQEDFWVKREVLYVLSDAMKMVAHMDAVDDPASKAPADPAIAGRHTFRNENWEVTLLFDQNGENQGWRVRPDSTIKNVQIGRREQDLGSPALRNGGVWFRLSQGGTVWKIGFEGTPVPWGQTHALADGKWKEWPLLGNPDPSKPMELEQVFDATDAPITQIDEIAISKVSHKNANRVLIAANPERYGQKPPSADAKATSTTGAAPGAAASGGAGGGAAPVMPAGPAATGGSSSMSGPPGAQGAGPGSKAASNVTPNYKLDRNRYLFVTEQSRHLPLAVTLTVDQSHLQEVLAAFANSRLRFQTTQVEFRRVPAAAAAPSGSTQLGGFPMATGPRPGSASTLAPRTPSSGGTVGSGASSLDGPPRGMNPTGPTAGPAAGPVVAPENPNLIEATVYGVATLYERPPDAK